MSKRKFGMEEFENASAPEEAPAMPEEPKASEEAKAPEAKPEAAKMAERDEYIALKKAECDRLEGHRAMAWKSFQDAKLLLEKSKEAASKLKDFPSDLLSEVTDFLARN